MHTGTPISARPTSPAAPIKEEREEARPVVGFASDRVLTTAEANEFLRRAKGFLEKRRSSGIDSPPYIQTRPRGAVLYRVSDLIAYEDSKMRTSSSDHACI